MVRQIDESQPELHQTRLAALEKTLDTVREDSEVAHVLLGLSAALGEVRTVQETLDKAVRMVPQLCGGDRCFAVAWDEVNQRFEISAMFGFDKESEERLLRLAEGPDGLPLITRAIHDGNPLLVPDALKSPFIPESQVRERKMGAYLCIPLVRWGQEFGGLGVEFNEPRRFGSKDAALARGIARQVGVALVNSRRFNLLQSLRTFGLRAGGHLRLTNVVAEAAEGAMHLMSADGAAVYSLDSQNKDLVVSATHGLSESTQQIISRIDVSAEPWNSLLLGRTVFVPNLAEVVDDAAAPASAVAAVIPGSSAGTTGALVAFYRKSAHLGPDELEALNVAAAQAATAIENARRFERQRRVARSLQSGLMAGDMPAVQGCEIGAIYEPASAESDVGGDFFDSFELPDGRIAIVVGDVSGKGAEAAAQTAQAKYMLRAFAMRNPAPSSVLFHLNNALVQSMAEDRFTTAVYGVLDPETHECQLAIGGHPPPLVFRKKTGRVEIPNLNGSLIGAFEDQQYEPDTIKLEAGDVFLAYTDGLVEARHDDDLFGRDRIAESLGKHAPSKGAKELARAIYEDAQEFGELVDDTVVFALTCLSD
jgi:GAF domain-containing protein